MSARVLMVDGEAGIAVTLSALLEPEGYRIVIAFSLDDALVRVDCERFDIILLGSTLGGEECLQILATLRETAPDCATIILSDQSDRISAFGGIGSSLCEFLPTTCSFEDLRAAIVRGLEKRRAILRTRLDVEAERERLLIQERETRAEAERNARLQAVTAALSAAATVSEVGQAIAEQVVAVTGANAAALGVMTGDGSTMTLASAIGYRPEDLRAYAQFSLDAPLPMSHSSRTHQAIWIRDRSTFLARYPHLSTEPSRARIAVIPLEAGGHVLGVISLSFSDGNDFTLAEKEFILAVGRECARALERALFSDEVRRARQEAEDAHRRLHELFRSAPALIAVTHGPDHVIEIVNERFLDLVGCADSQVVVGKPIREAFPELVGTGYLELADRVYASGQPFVDPEMQARVDRDGDGVIDRRWTSVVVQPYRDEAGHVAGLLFHGVDVTERTRADRSHAFLAEVSKLLATSLDPLEILDILVRQAVPNLGDWCIVDLLEENQRLRRVAVACADPAKESLTQLYLASYQPDATTEQGTGQVIQTGCSIRVSNITDEVLRGGARDAREYEILQALGLRACVLVPLVARGRVLGVFSCVSASADHRYSDDDLALIEDLARRVGLALDNARLYQAEQRARGRAEALQEITAVLATPRTPAEVADLVVARAMRLLGATRGALGLIVDGGATFKVIRIGGYPDDTRVREELQRWERFPIAVGSTWRQAVLTAEAIFTASAEERITRHPNLVQTQEALGFQASATIPLVVNRQVNGILWLGFPEPRSFSTEDRGFLLALAEQCAQALDRARLDVAERAARQRLAVLAETSRLFIEASLDEQSLLDTVCRRVAEEVGDGCVISFRSLNGEGFDAAAIFHPDPEALALAREMTRHAASGTTSVAAHILTTGESVLIPEIGPEHLETIVHADRLAYSRRFGFHSLAAVPLRSRRKILGTLSVWRDQPGRSYREDDVRLLQDMADRAAISLENARLFAQAQEAVRVRDEFLSIAAHELKTPLTGLRVTAQFLLRALDRAQPVESARLQQHLSVINQQSMKLASLVNQLLDVSRLEAGRLSLDPVATDLAILVQGIAAAAQARTERHTISVQTEGSLVVAVDPLRLEQVVTNLLDNAIKYSPDGGPIELALTRATMDQVAISVTDRGIGIPVAHRAQIFDRFYQAHAGGHFGGMGLGLYISKQIVELHGGILEAEFPDEGGTRFIVRIPLVGNGSGSHDLESKKQGWRLKPQETAL